jgi:biopolymer transport protein ExbD
MVFGKRSVFGGFGSGAGTPVPSLNLTALMDILSNLLFFLLAAYAAQATEVENKAEMHLPASTSQARLQLQLTVSITQHFVEVADSPVTPIENGKLVEPEDEEGKIASLYVKLVGIKERRAQVGRDQAGEASGILLLADKDTDSDVVSKVLRTAGHAGFVNVRFGVIAQ